MLARCDRCQVENPAVGSLGVSYLRLDNTGAHDSMRLCEDCADLLWRFLHDEVRHIHPGDPVSIWGNAHLMSCPSCAAHYGAPIMNPAAVQP
jgi:hypothetical protein